MSAPPKVECKKCGKDYVNVAGLVAHLKRVHLCKDVNTKNWQELNVPNTEGEEEDADEESRNGKIPKPEAPARVGDFDDQVTINYYLNLLKKDNKRITHTTAFHQGFFPSFAAIVTSGGYLVKKKGLSGKIVGFRISQEV
jgi:hypothetical protein